MKISASTTASTTRLTGEARREAAKALVERLREDLHAAARDGRLSTAFAHGLLESHLEANAAWPWAGALVGCALGIEVAAAQRSADPQQDCANPWGIAADPSCAETVLREHEARMADALAETLVTGPWPLF